MLYKSYHTFAKGICGWLAEIDGQTPRMLFDTGTIFHCCLPVDEAVGGNLLHIYFFGLTYVDATLEKIVRRL